MLNMSMHVYKEDPVAQYCVNRNAQSSGDHEVHNLAVGTTCLPAAAHRLPLGEHASCHSAVRAAKVYYPQSNGCVHCAKACHTG